MKRKYFSRALCISICFLFVSKRSFTVSDEHKPELQTPFQLPCSFTPHSDDGFLLKSGWRTNCKDEYKIIKYDKFALEKDWARILFVRPNAVSEGFAPSLNDLIHRTNFHQYRSYGNHVEAALNNLFIGSEQQEFISRLEWDWNKTMQRHTRSHGGATRRSPNALMQHKWG